MRKLLFTIPLLLVLQFSLGQEAMDVFGIARKGTPQQLTELLKTNPKAVNAVDKNGFSPLILAAYRGNNEVAKLLVENGSDINYNTEMGTALMACVVRGNNDMATYLIAKNANVNLTDDQNTTALMYAVQFKNIDITKQLLAHKADKTITDKKGKTAFEYAVFSGDENIIKLLK